MDRPDALARKYTRRRVLAGLAVGFATVACGPGAVMGSTPATSVEASGRVAGSPSPAGQPCLDPRAYLQMVINVHETVHVDESAATLLRAIDLFEKYRVAGDFYLTGPMVRLYSEQQPGVLDRLRDSRMAISYHVRPPHPLYTGFDQRLKGLSDTQLRQTLLDYETYGLDLATGDLNRDEWGGYTYVAQELERNPVVVTAPDGDTRIKNAALEVYRSLGAKMAVFFHETGTKPEQPFEYRNGLLARPSDFSITRWSTGTLTPNGSDKDPFWWNMLMGAHATEYNPAAYLQAQVGAWTYSRPAFVTSLIHENNFSRSGPEAWTARYYADADKTKPLSPPFDMNAPGLSKLRSQAEQEAIWAAYEVMVAYAAKNLRVATSEDILALATASGTSGAVASGCAVLHTNNG
jgi:hypothetical protein